MIPSKLKCGGRPMLEVLPPSCSNVNSSSTRASRS